MPENMARCASMKASLAVLGRRKGSEASAETVRHMAEQEQRHLETFDLAGQ